MFSSEQQKTVAIVTKLSGSLSALGDTYIIYDILSNRKKWATSYHRIMLGMSLVDFMVSAMFILSSWAIPADVNPEYGVFQPSGNVHTCNFQGFIITFGIAAPIYNLSLCFYYYAVIVKRWKEARVKKLEIGMHIFALVLGLSTAIVGLLMEQYNNFMNQCWVHGEPFECESDSTVPCTRGQDANLYRLFLYCVPLWTWQITSTAALACVYLHVHKQEKKVKKWRLSERESSNLTLEVAWQSFWYLLAFYITWIPTTIGGILEFGGTPPTFASLMIIFLTMPLQGFMNCLIYVRPKYLQWRRNNKPKSNLYWLNKFTLRAGKGIQKQPGERPIIPSTSGICVADGGELKSTMERNGESDNNSNTQREIIDPNVRILSFWEESITMESMYYDYYENIPQQQQYNVEDNSIIIQQTDSESPTIISNVVPDSRADTDEEQDEYNSDDWNDECRSDGIGRVSGDTDR